MKYCVYLDRNLPSWEKSPQSDKVRDNRIWGGGVVTKENNEAIQ